MATVTRAYAIRLGLAQASSLLARVQAIVIWPCGPIARVGELSLSRSASTLLDTARL